MLSVQKSAEVIVAVFFSETVERCVSLVRLGKEE